MKSIFKQLFFILFCVLILSCNQNKEIQTKSLTNTKTIKFEKDFPYEIALKDSVKLTQITGRFYRGKSGILYMKTFAQREVNGHLSDYEYFNGDIPQEIEPEFLTEIDDSFYFKDRKNIYLLFPTSGGERFLTLKDVDLNSFKTVKSLYNFGFDKNSFFEKNEKIEGFSPKTSEILKDNKGNAISLKSGNSEYILGQ